MEKNTKQNQKLSRGLLYLSFIFVFPLVWYFIEKSWYKKIRQKLEDKLLLIWERNQKMPVIWKKINEFFQLNSEIAFNRDLSKNLFNYQKALESVWDNLKNSDFNFPVEQLKSLIRFSDFLEESKQLITEYNSDAVLFNQSLKKWPSNIVGANLEFEQIKLFSLVLN